MASPQREHGYTGIANEILEAITQANFTLRELKIVLCVLRNTYGWGRKKCYLSLSQVAKATGLTKGGVSGALGSLIEHGVLKRYEDRSIEFCKNYHQWGVAKSATGGFQIGNPKVAKSATPLFIERKERKKICTNVKGKTEKRGPYNLLPERPEH